jgi:succinyl-CoA synthetase beta subunit
VADADAVRRIWAELHANVQRAQPGLKLDGVLVEAMSPHGLELVVGARRDARWGPIVMLGLGGIWVEALGDVRLMAPDLTEGEIIEELGKLKTAKLLQGFRNSPPLDVKAVAAAAAAIGGLMRARPDIIEIDVNPLMVHADGHGATALDALIVTGGGEPGAL